MFLGSPAGRSRSCRRPAWPMGKAPGRRRQWSPATWPRSHRSGEFDGRDAAHRSAPAPLVGPVQRAGLHGEQSSSQEITVKDAVDPRGDPFGGKDAVTDTADPRPDPFEVKDAGTDTAYPTV